MKSIGQKIQQIDGLNGTTDLNAWEQGFVSAIWVSTHGGTHTGALSEKQIAIIERIWSRHFA